MPSNEAGNPVVPLGTGLGAIMTKLNSVSDNLSENPWTYIQLLIDEDLMLNVTVDVLFRLVRT